MLIASMTLESVLGLEGFSTGSTMETRDRSLFSLIWLLRLSSQGCVFSWATVLDPNMVLQLLLVDTDLAACVASNRFWLGLGVGVGHFRRLFCFLMLGRS